MAREEQITSFLQAAGWSGADCHPLAGDASNRRYLRLGSAQQGSAILMDAPSHAGEGLRPFLEIAAFLSGAGLSPPRILAQDVAQGLLLLEDLGDDLFFNLMARVSHKEAALYEAACDVLMHLRHVTPSPLPPLDTDWLISAAGLFFDWYAPHSDLPLEQEFNAAFRVLATPLDAVNPVFVFRDFHAQNLLWLPDRTGVARVGLLDFQDALLGHPAYDLVSMLQDARRDVPAEMEAQIIARYLAQSGDAPEGFRQAYALLGLQRNLRILGIFARLCLQDGKAGYVDMIPRVHGYVRRNLMHPALQGLRQYLDPLLPDPTDTFLHELKQQCATYPQP